MSQNETRTCLRQGAIVRVRRIVSRGKRSSIVAGFFSHPRRLARPRPRLEGDSCQTVVILVSAQRSERVLNQISARTVTAEAYDEFGDKASTGDERRRTRSHL